MKLHPAQIVDEIKKPESKVCKLPPEIPKVQGKSLTIPEKNLNSKTEEKVNPLSNAQSMETSRLSHDKKKQ